MNTFSFENKYGNITYFDFDVDRMTIRETWIGGQVREFKFKYNDIRKYVISPDSAGYYQLSFYANNKEIEVNDNGKLSNRDIIMTSVKVKVSDSALAHKKTFEDSENDIRKVIYNNTPLRSELDMLTDKAREINKLYQETSEDKFGIVYLTGPKKNIEDYNVDINGVSIFTIYTERQEQKLKEVGQYYEHLAKPTWVNNNTIAFRIPYGNWRIGYTFHTRVYSSPDARGIRTTDGPKSVDIVINEQHKEVKLKLKLGLFSNKLIEI